MRRPKNWDQPCPNTACPLYQLKNRGNISARSTYKSQSGVRRCFRCSACGKGFSETRDTVFYDLKTPEQQVIYALKMLLVGNKLSDVRFVFGITEGTLLEWLKRAASKAEQINSILLKDLQVQQVQLDELWAFIARKTSLQACDNGESPEFCEDGRQWIWTAVDPESRLLIAAKVGPRTIQTATALIALVAAAVSGVPVFFSDGLASYLKALLTHYFQGERPAEGSKKKATPHEDLVYAQMIKVRRGRRLVEVKTKVVCGAKRLARLGLSIGTSFVERLNLTLRAALGPLVRKGSGFCKKRERLEQRVEFFQAFYNLARPHMSLQYHAVADERGACTPGMVVGISDHVWSFRELLTAKLEPPHNQSTGR